MSTVFPRARRALRLPTVHGGIGLVVILAVGLIIGPGSYWGYLLTLTLLYAIAAFGLNIPGGFLGQLTMGQGAVFAVGAYTSAILTTDLHWPILVTVPLALVAGGVVGFLMGAPAARLDVLGLGMITLGATIIAGDVATNLTITGGANGITVTAPSFLPGFAPASPDQIFILITLVAVLVYVGHWYLRIANFGRGALAIKSDQLGATALGMKTYWVKVIGFSIGSALGALAGSFYGFVQGVVSPDGFGTELSIMFLLMILLGGAGSRVGPLLGIAIVGILPIVLAPFPGTNVYIDGALLIVVMRFLPRGIYSRSYAPVPRRVARTALSAALQSTSVSVQPAESVQTHKSGSGFPVLALTGLSRSFGGVRALNDVTLTLEAGAVMAVIGPNGSGKTTLMNVICGYYRADAGEALLDGTPIHGWSPAAIARHGVARTFQVPKTFSALSIDEHIALASHYATESGDSALTQIALSFLDEVFPGAGDRVGPRELDYGHLRFLEIGTAILRRPRLLLLDEPAAGLSVAEIDRLIRLVREVADAGVAVMLVEHHLDFVREIADSAVVMNLGHPLWQGGPHELEQSEAVREAYLGGTR